MHSIQLSNLLACLYRAPLDATGWQEFLNCLTEVTGADGGGFLRHDLVRGHFTLRAVDGAHSDPSLQHAYNQYYGKLDPWRDPYLSLKTTAVIPGHALVPITDLRKTEIYNDLLLPRGVVHPVILPGIVAPDVAENVTIWWSEQHGPPGDEIVALLEMLRPHLRQSLETSHALSSRHGQAECLSTVLDHMEQAVMVLDEQLQVRQTNHAADRLLERADGLSVVGRRMRVHLALQSTLDAMLRRALKLAQAAGDPGKAEPEVLALPRTGDRRALPLRIMPLRVESHAVPAHVLVLAGDTARVPAVAHTTMRSLWGATPTETAIANGLLAGLPVNAIAQRRRISEETTRGHLKMLFQRTGTSRQSELILLLLSLPRTVHDAATAEAHHKQA